MPRNPLPQQVSEKEHTAFGQIAEACQQAHDGMMEMARLRRDQRELWTKAAVNMKVLEGQLYDLATQGMFTVEDGKFGGGATH